jgi:ABC-type branched-subunit amino acid transport system substrate-binding protein
MKSMSTACAVGAIALGLTSCKGTSEKGANPVAATVKIGQTMPYSGPASAYGTIGRVETAYFKKVDEEGGIGGRQIELVSVDDGYSPPKAVEQVRKLVEQEHVLFLFQTLGTAPNAAIQPYLNDAKVPQLFVASGATRWGDPEHFPWTMGYNPSYDLEGRTYGKHIASVHPTSKVAVLYQNDDFGKDLLKGLKAGLAGGPAVVAETSYEVTDATIDSQVASLKGSGADVFVNVTTPKFAAQAIRRAYDIGWKPTQYLANVSASVRAVLMPAGLDKSTGILTVGYFKDPTDKQWDDDPAMVEFKAFLHKYVPDASPEDGNNAYGYIAAQTLVQVLKQCGDDWSRANVMKQAASLTRFAPGLLLPGIHIETGPHDFFPFDELALVRFDGATWKATGEPVAGAR